MPIKTSKKADELTQPNKATRSMDDNEIKRRILDAAVWCVEQLGLNNVTIDDIVKKTAFSRATVYRRFRNREILLTELVNRHIEPYEEEGRKILTNSSSFVEQIQEIFVWSVMGMSHSHWLKDMFKGGISSENLALYSSMYRDRAMDFLQPFVDNAHARGDLRLELSCEELVDWFMREIPFYVATGPTDRRYLIKKFRLFVRPVLLPEPTGNGSTEPCPHSVAESIKAIQSTLQSIEQKLAK